MPCRPPRRWSGRSGLSKNNWWRWARPCTAVEHFTRAARHGAVPAPLRHRLALAGGQVAAQREALARATASLDRAIDVLIPRHAPKSFYSAAGASERHGGGGALLA
jgi:hypothetical protein